MATQIVKPYVVPSGASSPQGFEAPILTISSHILIAAPASFVFATFRDTSTWPAWNTFVPACVVKQSETSKASSISEHVLNAKDEMAMQVKMMPDANARQQGCIVTNTVDTPDTDGIFRICWEGKGFPKMMLRTLRTTEVVPRGEDACEFRTWEVMAGVLAYVVKTMYGTTLQERFEDCSREIKEYVEKKWLAEKGNTGGPQAI